MKKKHYLFIKNLVKYEILQNLLEIIQISVLGKLVSDIVLIF